MYDRIFNSNGRHLGVGGIKTTPSHMKRPTFDSRGQMGSNLVGLFIGVLIAGIVAIQVFIPVINDAISQSSVSGTAATVLGLLPLFAALLVLIALAAPLMRRV